MPTKTGKITKREQKRLITILRDDFHFDIVTEMVNLYHKVSRSRMPKKEKYKFQFQVLSKIWEYSLPKLKVEEKTGDTGDKIQFNIMVGGTDDKPKLSGPNPNAVTIPTQVDPDGNHVIQIPDN